VSLPQPPPWLPPNAVAAINAASAALSAAFESPTPLPVSPPPPQSAPAPAGGTGSPRTLLDLFPPTVREATAPSLPISETTTTPPPIAAIEPPRVAVKPRVFPAPAQGRPAPVTYETFYGLADKPFAAAPDLRFLYHSAAHDTVLQDLIASIGKRDAVALLTGPSGIGKTLLCGALVDQLDRRTLVSRVADALNSPEHLLRTLLVDFGVISQAEASAGQLASASRDDLAGALRDFLGSLPALQATALLIVDNVDRLPPVVSAELRNLVERQQLQVILVANAKLERSLDERVAVRAELGPLEQDEISGYVAHRLAVAGRGERIDFSEPALQKIFALSEGVPGIVNQICDRALTLGYQASASRIDGDFVEEAARHLGLSPAEGAQTWRDRALIAVVMLALVLAGAAGAGWVFREPLRRAVSQFTPVR
jgi:type II secretory pathway predicted ATPase ExeA